MNRTRKEILTTSVFLKLGQRLYAAYTRYEPFFCLTPYARVSAHCMNQVMPVAAVEIEVSPQYSVIRAANQRW